MESQPTQQKKLPKLTKKRKGFVKDFIETENATEAVVRNYDVKNRVVAKTVGSELLTFPNVIEAIEVKRKSLKEALIDKGITEDYLASKVNILLNGVNEKGVADYTAIDKGLKHATSIYGVESLEIPKENVYNFFFEPKFQQNIKNYDQNLKEQILNKDVEENQNSI